MQVNAMGSTKALLTADQFAQLKTGELENYELVEGELIPLPSGTGSHAWTRDELAFLLRSYFRRNSIGLLLAEMDCRLGDDTIRRPDIAVFLNRKAQSVPMDVVPIPRAPDIAIEVLSPSEGAVDVNRKVREYIAAGCSEVWVVDQVNDEILVWTKGSVRVVNGDESLETPLLPGFEVHLNELFVKP